MSKSNGLPKGVVVMRHGKREDSINPSWQIKAEFPFDTPLAHEECEIASSGKQLVQAGRFFDVVYTSPFLRCVQTAQRLMRAVGCEQAPVFIHKGLSEVHNPRLLFKVRQLSVRQRAKLWFWRVTYTRHSRAVRQQFGTKARIVERSSWPRVPESELASTLRLREVIMEVAARHPGKQVLVVSHGKAVQVAHEALGCTERVEQVHFAGFIAFGPKQKEEGEQQEGEGRQQQQQQHQTAAEQEALGGAGPPADSVNEIKWTDFEVDAKLPWFGLDVA